MAIANRELDASEQKEVVNCNVGLAATALTYPLYLVPRPMTLVAGSIAAFGLSGSPAYLLKVARNSAAGATVISSGATLTTPLTIGTSGPMAIVLAAAGSSFLTLATGDLITLTTSVSNTAAFVQVGLVLQSIQDIKSHF